MKLFYNYCPDCGAFISRSVDKAATMKCHACGMMVAPRVEEKEKDGLFSKYP